MTENFGKLFQKEEEKEEFDGFYELRKKTHAEMKRELIERLEKNPNPTNQELMFGAYVEEVEPQMRMAIQKLYEKGYATESSGFGGSDNWELQQVDGFFEIDKETEEKLKKLGVVIARGDYDFNNARRTRIEFQPKEASRELIEEKWREIIEILPSIGKPSYSLSAGSFDFRTKHLGEDEARMIQIKTSLERGIYPPEEKEKMEKWLREHEKE